MFIFLRKQVHKPKILLKKEFRRKKLKLKLKILRRVFFSEEFFFVWVFVEYSSSIRWVFVDKFFAMCRWALNTSINNNLPSNICDSERHGKDHQKTDPDISD